MKKFNLFAISLLALIVACFTACENKQTFGEEDYSEYIVGTWTAHLVNYAEALVFNADGTLESYTLGPDDNFNPLSYYFEDHGTYTIKGDKLVMTFDDGCVYNITISIIPGKLLTFDYDGQGIDFYYDYCEEDLADEIIGMWVCNNGPTNEEDDMSIQIFNEDGTVSPAGFANNDNDVLVNQSGITYKVIGIILFQTFPKEIVVDGAPQYIVSRLTYTPNATSLGDVLTQTVYAPNGDNFVEMNSSFLRVKESLDLAGKGYYYHDVFVSNVDGEDKDIDFMGYTFNFAKMTNSELNKLLNSLLFNVEFLDANTIQYIYMYNNTKEVLEAPIVVEGNKVIIKMSAKEPALKDVVLYAFQDADCNQLHFYMSRTAFVNFHANMQAKLMKSAGQLDLNDDAAVKAIYDSIDAAVNTINVSLVFKAK